MLDIALYFFFWAAIILHFSGYILVLALIRKLRPLRIEQGPTPDTLPNVAIIVPTYNEEFFVGEKLKNLVALAYPASKMRIIIADGGSSDRTMEIVGAFARETSDARIEAFRSAERGKIPQLNEALARVAPGALVVISDADAQTTDGDALLKTAAYLVNDRGIGLIGGWTSPPASADATLNSEHAYWDKQNRLRYMETICFSSSIVVAPYYAFWKDQFTGFPKDCIADDIYISFQMHLKQLRVIYAPDINVIEFRQPGSLRETFLHKLRKANAYTVELLRVGYLVPQMRRRFMFYYLVKIFQFFYLPWASIAFGLWSVRLLLAQNMTIVGISWAVLALSILAASATMVAPPNRSRGGIKLKSFVSSAVIFALMWIVMILNFLLFPFTRQSSSYSRISGNHDPRITS